MIYVETTKPKSLAESNVTLYYMYANGIDTPDNLPIFLPITNDEVLEIAYKIYKKTEDNNKL